MNYYSITKNDMLNGDGLRVVLWVAGCSHNCPNCQNPFTHDPNGGKLFNHLAQFDVFDELRKEHISGLTLSGGDPMYMENRSDILDLVKKVKYLFPNKTIWMYTGYTYDQINDDPILSYIDVLVDGRYIEKYSIPHPEWRGSSNQRIINLKEKFHKIAEQSSVIIK